MAIHFLTNEMWENLSNTLFSIANQCLEEHKEHTVSIEVSMVILQSVEHGEQCQILYGLARLQIRSLVQGDTQAYQIATSAHDHVKRLMKTYQQACYDCKTIHDTTYDEDYMIYLCKACQLSRKG